MVGGVGKSSTSDISYSVIPTMKWASWWYPHLSGPLCDTHYMVVDHSDCAVIICTYCYCVLRITYPVLRYAYCDTHYLVVGHSDCTGCSLHWFNRHRMQLHRLGSDVGISGVEGIFTTSNYWNVFQRILMKSGFYFPFTLIVICKMQIIRLTRVLESQSR